MLQLLLCVSQRNVRYEHEQHTSLEQFEPINRGFTSQKSGMLRVLGEVKRIGNDMWCHMLVLETHQYLNWTTHMPLQGISQVAKAKLPQLP